jgi:hypothetical protein
MISMEIILLAVIAAVIALIAYDRGVMRRIEKLEREERLHRGIPESEREFKNLPYKGEDR